MQWGPKEENASELGRRRPRWCRIADGPNPPTAILGAQNPGGIDHQGFADGDRTFDISAPVELSVENTLWSLFKTQTFVNISTRDGFFYGVISFMSINYGKLKMTLLIKE